MDKNGELELSFNLLDPLEKECFDKLNSVDIVRRTVYIVDLYKKSILGDLSLLEEKLLEILKFSIGSKDGNKVLSILNEIKKEPVKVKEKIQEPVKLPDIPDVSISKNLKPSLVPKNINQHDYNDVLNEIVDKSF